MKRKGEPLAIGHRVQIIGYRNAKYTVYEIAEDGRTITLWGPHGIQHDRDIRTIERVDGMPILMPEDPKKTHGL